MKTFGSCPGSRQMAVNSNERSASELSQWPVQLHLVSPLAPYFEGSDLLLSADCVAYAAGDFHAKHLKGKSLAIACPKLDDGQDAYVEKLSMLIDEAKINTITVMIMQVPCCRGLLSIVNEAKKRASRDVPTKLAVVGLQGQIISEEWV